MKYRKTILIIISSVFVFAIILGAITGQTTATPLASMTPHSYLPLIHHRAESTPTFTPLPPSPTNQPPTNTPTPPPTNTPVPPPTATEPSQNCDPSYPTVCIPSPPPDLDCGEIPYRNFQVLEPDPHRFDGDNDGIGCEE